MAHGWVTEVSHTYTDRRLRVYIRPYTDPDHRHVAHFLGTHIYRVYIYATRVRVYPRVWTHETFIIVIIIIILVSLVLLYTVLWEYGPMIYAYSGQPFNYTCVTLQPLETFCWRITVVFQKYRVLQFRMSWQKWEKNRWLRMGVLGGPARTHSPRAPGPPRPFAPLQLLCCCPAPPRLDVCISTSSLAPAPVCWCFVWVLPYWELA